jgi:hypothetical protein
VAEGSTEASKPPSTAGEAADPEPDRAAPATHPGAGAHAVWAWTLPEWVGALEKEVPVLRTIMSFCPSMPLASPPVLSARRCTLSVRGQRIHRARRAVGEPRQRRLDEPDTFRRPSVGRRRPSRPVDLHERPHAGHAAGGRRRLGTARTRRWTRRIPGCPGKPSTTTRQALSTCRLTRLGWVVSTGGSPCWRASRSDIARRMSLRADA